MEPGITRSPASSHYSVGGSNRPTKGCSFSSITSLLTEVISSCLATVDSKVCTPVKLHPIPHWAVKPPCSCFAVNVCKCVADMVQRVTGGLLLANKCVSTCRRQGASISSSVACITRSLLTVQQLLGRSQIQRLGTSQGVNR